MMSSKKHWIINEEDKFEEKRRLYLKTSIYLKNKYKCPCGMNSPKLGIQ
jgi:hypothetical protein